MSAAGAAVSGSEATKVSLVIDALSRDAILTRVESALLDELEDVPAVATARAAYDRRMEAASRREEQARFEAAREAEATRQAEQAAEVANRRAEWKAADPLIRALHVLAKELKPDKFAERLLRLAKLIENPQSTLRRPGGVHPWGETFPASDRPPPATFHPIAAGLDPEDGDGR